MSLKDQEESADDFSVHPLIYEGDVVKFYAVNRSLICSARDEGAPVDLVSACPSKSKNRCPERRIQDCRGLYFKDCPAKTFIEETLNDSEYQKLFALLEIIDQKCGLPWNREKFRDLTDVSYKGKNFLELKPTDQVRIGCFFEPGYKLYLTHGFHKKKPEWPSNELDRLKTIYDDYLIVNNTAA